MVQTELFSQESPFNEVAGYVYVYIFFKKMKDKCKVIYFLDMNRRILNLIFLEISKKSQN